MMSGTTTVAHLKRQLRPTDRRPWVKRLLDAIVANDLDTVDGLLAGPSGSNHRTELNQPWQDHDQARQILIVQAYNPPLITAIHHGHLAVVERLLRAPGIDLDVRDTMDNPALVRALHTEHPTTVAIVTRLIDAGASTQVLVKDWRHPPHLLPLGLWTLLGLTIHTPALAELLDARGVLRLDELDDDGVLHRVLKALPKSHSAGVLPTLRWLRDRGVATDRCDGAGRTLLEVARPVAPPEVVAELERWALEALPLPSLGGLASERSPAGQRARHRL